MPAIDEQRFKEKWKGNSPSPLILSLGGARKIKEAGYPRPQAQTNKALSIISFFSLFV